MLVQVTNWSLVLGKANLKNLLLIPLKLSVGRISFYPKVLYYLISGLWTLIVFLAAFKGVFKNKIWGFLLIIPILLGFIFSFFSPLLDYFRFLYLAPILSILIALGINKNWKKVGLILVFGIFSFVYLLNPAFQRENWKGLAASLDNAKALYIIESVADPVKYYRPDVIIKDLKTRQLTEDEIVVVPYAETIHGFDHNQKFQELGYKKISSKDFREIILEVWKK